MTEIGVHHADDVGVRHREAVHHGTTQAHFPGAVKNPDASAGGPLLRPIACAVSRIVVDDNHLRGDLMRVHGIENALEERIEAVALVIRRDDERHIGATRTRHPSSSVAAALRSAQIQLAEACVHAHVGVERAGDDAAQLIVARIEPDANRFVVRREHQTLAPRLSRLVALLQPEISVAQRLQNPWHGT